MFYGPNQYNTLQNFTSQSSFSGYSRYGSAYPSWYGSCPGMVWQTPMGLYIKQYIIQK